ncbi:MAG: D-alanyl-D-alanine carboxypeptidase [OM182 bacterium]|jgi:D-alanyl-D-alanine carboxypeptidase (penicillin-binding protein 5/6)|nr:MAG: D-alanyl-D-alanine carboxypeptidase [OM182 bacterium]
MRRLGLVLVFFALVSGSAVAANSIPLLPPPNLQASSFLLIDADTNKVLAEHNARERSAPASLTKIMTGYVVEEEIRRGRLGVEERVQISVNAWRTGGSKMFIREGTSVAVSELLRGVIIQSGNDASVALAEHIAGSEDQFADLMNQQAQLLNMSDTQFRNSTGLPDEQHYSTAWDLALLTRALIKNHPEQYALYSQKSYTYNNIEQPNRNRLLWRDRSVDGVKTGFTNAAGYCLVASAERNGMRLISVVLGTENDEARMRESQKLLSYGFRNYETKTLYQPGTTLQEQPIFYGEVEALPLGVAEDVIVTFPKGYYQDIDASISVPAYFEAPISKGDVLGTIELRLGDDVIYAGDVLAEIDVEESGWLAQFGDYIFLLFD